MAGDSSGATASQAATGGEKAAGDLFHGRGRRELVRDTMLLFMWSITPVHASVPLES